MAQSEAALNPGIKLFVLDTSVIVYDGLSYRNFDEHHVFIPSVVLEECDDLKKGGKEENRQVRDFIRAFRVLADGGNVLEGMRIDSAHPTPGLIRVVNEKNGHSTVNGRAKQRREKLQDATQVFGSHKADHRILNVALSLQQKYPRNTVVLVSKDINLCLKAKTLRVEAEDYENTRVQDIAQLYRGTNQLELDDSALVKRLCQEDAVPFEFFAAAGVPLPQPNEYFMVRNHKDSALAYFDSNKAAMVRLQKKIGYGISPRNAEQAFALHAVMNPDVQLVSLLGSAGTGKTLLALAGALEQRRNFRQIYLARPIVPLSNKDIGYLPGDIHSKINPYMQPLWDNLGVIRGQLEEKSAHRKAVDEMVEHEKLQIVPLAYIRGRSFVKVMFIVDEAQNLTPHEVKTIVTRAGEGTKIVFTGDIFQIDTPFLDAHTNGLSYLIDRMKGQSAYAHVTLKKGERSKLADLAANLL